jgi:hypothetical protein
MRVPILRTSPLKGRGRRASIAGESGEGQTLGVLLALCALVILPACYTKTVSRTGGFGPRAGEVHEPDAPDNALEDAADVIYERDWKRRERGRDD